MSKELTSTNKDGREPGLYGSAGSRRWRVHGYALVPVEAEVYIDAPDVKAALAKARVLWQANKQAIIVGNSADESSAHDWRPTAELIENAPGQTDAESGTSKTQ